VTSCSSCKGALPGGCSTCRPIGYTVGGITFYPALSPVTHTCPDCMRGLPCSTSDALTADRAWKASQPSLSAAVGAVIDRTKSEPDRRSPECQ
jgi:hypothetical protein